MNRTPVTSSDIISIGYDPALQQMEVEFRRGDKLYLYWDVPQEVYDELMIASSVGKYFASRVKGVYRFTVREKERK